jgi:hypothetical protein
MISCFGAIHSIAAKRGDGLRPELVELLKRSRADAELGAKSSFSTRDHEEIETIARNGDVDSMS